MSVKPPLIIRLNLVSSAGGGGGGAFGDSTDSCGASAFSFLPRKVPSPKKLVMDDARPRWAPMPMTLLMVSNVPPDLSLNMISRASLCAGSIASESLSKFCIVGIR